MRHLGSSILVAAVALLAASSLATAQTTTQTTTTTTVTNVPPQLAIAAPRPSYYSDYYHETPYYKPAPTMAELVQMLAAAGYTNPTGLELNGDVWTGKATMENHQVPIRFDRQCLWQLAP